MKIPIKKTNRTVPRSPYVAYIAGVYENYFYTNPVSPFLDNAYRHIPTVVNDITRVPKHSDSLYAEPNPFIDMDKEDWLEKMNKIFDPKLLPKQSKLKQLFRRKR